ncbi:MAG TPA: peptide deformylase, partial [Chitinophagaceae bacterium]|nr:peptide deformylase [Chitinophagaceae bacterium]
VGLAAPQVNKDVRVFIVDSRQIFENLKPEEKKDYPDDPGIRQVFINAHIEEIDGEKWAYNEGCLSIPKIREDIIRNETVTLRYQDENFDKHTKTFEGITARIILHEHDHLEGKLFIDYLPPLKRKLMKGKLDDISKGKVTVDYKMVFPK